MGYNSILKLKNVCISAFVPKAIADITITLNDSLVTMHFNLCNSPYESARVIRILAPLISSTYNVAEAEILKSYNEESTSVFSISFNYEIMKNLEFAIEDIAKLTLTANHVASEEILDIKYSDEEHEEGIGFLKVRVDVGYDESEEYHPIYKHRRFLENKLTEVLLMKVMVDLT